VYKKVWNKWYPGWSVERHRVIIIWSYSKPSQSSQRARVLSKHRFLEVQYHHRWWLCETARTRCRRTDHRTHPVCSSSKYVSSTYHLLSSNARCPSCTMYHILSTTALYQWCKQENCLKTKTATNPQNLRPSKTKNSSPQSRLGVCGIRWKCRISVSKTELNRNQNSKTENSVSAVRFSKTDLGSLGTVFHVVSFTIHLPTRQDQQSKYFSSCHISALLVLSHFSWQLVGPT